MARTAKPTLSPDEFAGLAGGTSGAGDDWNYDVVASETGQLLDGDYSFRCEANGTFSIWEGSERVASIAARDGISIGQYGTIQFVTGVAGTPQVLGSETESESDEDETVEGVPESAEAMASELAKTPGYDDVIEADDDDAADDATTGVAEATETAADVAKQPHAEADEQAESEESEEEDEDGQADLLMTEDGGILDGDYEFVALDDLWLRLSRDGVYASHMPNPGGIAAGEEGAVHVDAGVPGTPRAKGADTRVTPAAILADVKQRNIEVLEAIISGASKEERTATVSHKRETRLVLLGDEGHSFDAIRLLGTEPLRGEITFTRNRTSANEIAIKGGVSRSLVENALRELLADGSGLEYPYRDRSRVKIV